MNTLKCMKSTLISRGNKSDIKSKREYMIDIFYITTVQKTQSQIQVTPNVAMILLCFMTES